MNPIGANTWIWVSPLTDERLALLAPRLKTFGFDVVELPVEPSSGLSPQILAASADPTLPDPLAESWPQAEPVLEAEPWLTEPELPPAPLAAAVTVSSIVLLLSRPIAGFFHEPATAFATMSASLTLFWA